MDSVNINIQLLKVLRTFYGLLRKITLNDHTPRTGLKCATAISTLMSVIKEYWLLLEENLKEVYKSNCSPINPITTIMEYLLILHIRTYYYKLKSLFVSVVCDLVAVLNCATDFDVTSNIIWIIYSGRCVWETCVTYIIL